MQADNSFVNISVSSSSPGIDITALNISSANFMITLPYNAPTNVSITAHLCGMYNSTIIGLNYGECEICK